MPENSESACLSQNQCSEEGPELEGKALNSY